MIAARALVAALLLAACLPTPERAPRGEPLAAPTTAVAPPRVILISVDGLAPRFLEPLIEGGATPAFARLQRESAWTHNARTDPSLTITVPNHTGMLTGRPAEALPGRAPTLHHGLRLNFDPGPEHTLHSFGNPALDYAPSIFDVAHDRGLRTGFFVSKDKLLLLRRSYDAAHGAPHDTHGRDKLDQVVYERHTDALTERFIEALPGLDLVFLHLRDPDSAGHGSGWGSRSYLAALRDIDSRLAAILDALEGDPRPTWLILTADHGGVDHSHGDAERTENSTIPFYVRGPGLRAGADLYPLTSRVPPAPSENPVEPMPIRNLDAALLALELLELPPLPETLQPSLSLNRGPSVE